MTDMRTGLTEANSVTAADFNLDGFPDLAVGSFGKNAVDVFYGLGDGTFSSSVQTLAVGGGPVLTVSNDIDDDGDADIVVASALSDGISVLLNDGNGGFLPYSFYAAGARTNSLAIGDLNNDGVKDIAASNFNAGTVSIFRGNADESGFSTGTYLEVSEFPISATIDGIALTDLDNDGHLDLISNDAEDDFVAILLGNGDFTFQTGVSYTTAAYPYRMAVNDFDSDGFPDTVVANVHGHQVSLHRGQPGGVFSGFEGLAPANSLLGPTDLAVGDINGDGFDDIAVSTRDDDQVRFLLGYGNGSFDVSNTSLTTTDSPYGISLADLDGDGRLDVAAVTNGGNTLQVWIQNGLRAAAGGPYLVDEGSFVILDGSGSSSPNNDIATYEWDFDYDGITFDVDATGVSLTFDASGLDGAEERTIGLRVADASGLWDVATTNVIVQNVAPTIESLSAVGQTDLQQSLTNWWTGDVDASDAIGSADGVLQGDAVAGVSGVVGGAFQFGGNGSVNLGSVPSLDYSHTSSFSYELWVKTESLATQFLISTNYTCSPRHQTVTISNGLPYFAVRDASDQTVGVEATDPVELGEWAHVVGVRDYQEDFSRVLLYVDGVLVGEVADVTQNTFAHSANDYLGINYPCSAQFPLVGMLDEVRIYDRALSTQEVSARYSNSDILAQVGQAVQFSSSATDPAGILDPLSYAWNFGDGSVPVVATDLNEVSHTYDSVGSYGVTLTVDDGDGGVATKQIAVTVVDTGSNNAPLAVDVAGTSDEDGPAVTVNAVFTDVDATDSHSFGIDTTGTLGTVTNHSDGTFTYDPAGAFESLAAGETATDSFTYTVTDNQGASSTATVTMSITGANDAPVALDVTGSASEDGPAVTVNALFTDVDATDSHTFGIDTTGTLGTVTNHSDGTFTYVPSSNFNGIDTFKYQVTDSAGVSSAFQTVTISVGQVNDFGTWDGDLEVSMAEDSVATGTIAFSDVLDGSTGSQFALFSGPSAGSATVTPEGTWTYEPALDFTGSDSFVVSTFDDDGNFESTVILIHVLNGSDQLIEIIDQINDLASSGNLASNNVRPLIAKAENAIDKISKGNLNSALNQLNALVNQINAFINSGKLPSVDGQDLLTAINDVIQSIEAGDGTALRTLAGETDIGSTEPSVSISEAAELVVGTIGVELTNSVALPANVDEGLSATLAESIDELNFRLSDFGMLLSTDIAAADVVVVVHVDSTSDCGSAADGVLGCTSGYGNVTILSSWNWYFGNETEISPNQFDFQTVLTHELGHVIGLAHSSAVDSVMNAFLAPGIARRQLSSQDLLFSIDDEHGDPEALYARVGAAYRAELLSQALLEISGEVQDVDQDDSVETVFNQGQQDSRQFCRRDLGQVVSFDLNRKDVRLQAKRSQAIDTIMSEDIEFDGIF
ncbi:MAG: VCBS repeat-containing protein [Planctomycetales bacterium]|nr:VCBS repeat-containing protein [Planctomycetales bacterium]